MGSNEKLVINSDKAFALRMYENYIDKWTKQGTNEVSKEDEQPGELVQKGQEVIRGMFTVQNSGNCKYGGWSHAGMERFNDLYDFLRTGLAHRLLQWRRSS